MSPTKKKIVWAQSGIDEISQIADGRRVTLLAEGEYASLLIEANALRQIPISIDAPLISIPDRHRQDWLDQALKAAIRVRDLVTLYKIIKDTKKRNDTFVFSDISSNRLPRRGVYIVLDTTERNFIGDNFRIVRIGTHAVSEGSKASLKARLRNHLGPKSGVGNHRGSVFRRHVGCALLRLEGRTDRKRQELPTCSGRSA